MNLLEFCSNEPAFRKRVKRLEIDGELYAGRFEEFAAKFQIPLTSLFHSNGVALIDIEYGVDALGLMQYMESKGDMSGSKITVSEPVRSETTKNGIEDVFDIYREYSKKVGLDISIVRDDSDSILGWNKFGAIFWLNMFPEFCYVENLVYRLQRCKDNLLGGGVALLTQCENSIYEEERYERVLRKGLDEGLNIQLVEALGVLGNIGILLQN